MDFSRRCRNEKRNLSEPKQEDEDEDDLLPFGKISQKARRFDELESQKCNQTCEEDNYFSQDLFHSQFEIPSSDTMDRLSRLSPSTDSDECEKTKKDISTNLIELPPTTANNQQTLISGYQGVKVCRGAGSSSVSEKHTFEALPHPTKLFRRRKQQAMSVTKASQRSLRVQQHDKDNQSVAIHLRQLRRKQSRIDVIQLDPNDLQKGGTNPNTAVQMTQRTMTEKPITTTNISDWETIESWIHGRWKSQSGQHINWHVEEE